MTSSTVSKTEVKAALDVLMTIARGIAEAGQIPAGSLYSTLMVAGCTLEQFNRILSMLTKNGMVQVRSNVIHWTGDAELTAGLLKMS